MEEALRNREEALFTMRDLFLYSEEVTRSEFDRAASDILARHPGLLSLKWAPRVPVSQLEKYEAAARADHYPDFKIFASDTSVRTSPLFKSTDCFPVFYSAPLDVAPHTLGFDLTSSTAWPEFQQAAREGNLRASGRVPHLTGEMIGGSYLMELPVYITNTPGSEPERIGQLRGFLLGVFKPSAILENLGTQLPRIGLDMLMVEPVSKDEVCILHFLPANPQAVGVITPSIDELRNQLHYNIKLPFVGRTWELWFRPDPEWLRSQHSFHEFVIAAFILLISALLAIYLRGLFRQAIGVESLVAQRTGELTAMQHELREDIQRRILTEQALKASEERYRTLISQSSDAIWRLELPEPVSASLPIEDQTKRIASSGLLAECNNLTAELYGYKKTEKFLGHKLTSFPPHSRQRHEAVLHAFIRSGYRLACHESAEIEPGGAKRIFVHNLIGVIEDNRLTRIWVTERELTQQRLLEQERQAFERRLGETQRLESLGVLAGGIAHDFNNLLTGILGHASLGRCEIVPDSPLNSHFEEIETASRSAANLCQQMLAYAGKGRFVVKPHDLSQIVSQSSHLLQISLSKQAELRFRLADGLPLVQADATQIQQIVMNLVLNASEAIGKRDGLITLTTGLLKPDATTFAGCLYAPEHPVPVYVFLEVRDNGCGMSAEVINRIFEPFFTTKFAGRGLGLAAALGIVRSHHGALRVESKPGEGSSFTLCLPAADSDANSESEKNLTNTPWSAEGTILVIDDEAQVRSVAERMAQTLGFSALCAADGDQGIQLFELYRSAIKVVLLDLSMPGLSGEETLASLRARDPALRVILMSGYNQPELPTAINGKKPSFLSKPFAMAQFQAAVRHSILHE